jgi:hypothetical protein
LGWIFVFEVILSLDDALHISDQLSLDDQLRLIRLLSERVRRNLGTAGEPVDMLSLAGLGAEIWRQIDVDAYVAAERANWRD